MAYFLQNAEKILCAILFMAMTLLGFVNVMVRYLTNYSLASTEELLTHGFLLLTILGAAIAARSGDHLAVTLLYDLAPRPVRKLILIVSTLLAAFLLALSAWFFWQLLMNQVSSGLKSYALSVPAWYYTVALPFAFAIVLIRYIQYAIEFYHSANRKEGEHYV
ncbi:TRAP transporter small permease [Pusillimonas sp. ANT_WB101]|uniref:TRAP transporter small permease n=1 Tax=Pusillimonas sp. ANT_WB101 TaxID=2597356 RepID=UPI0011ED3A7E|nr:TRAP transporter small permease [Pusillimonas sp. ANT_WB101]KAA0911158.1 TRAP transporter small permease [Pusillimonas sp. ANT_WB101]